MIITTDIPLSNSECTELSSIIGCDETVLQTKFASYANAAIKEIISMFLGQKVFSRGTDILEYRLFLLIIYAFEGRIPEEQEVCRLFQTTSTGSRSLIRAVMSKYQYQLKEAVENTIKKLVDNFAVSEDNSSFIVPIHNLNLVEELNKQLAEIDTNLPPMQKKKGSVSTYEIMPSSYNRLCDKYGVTAKELEAEVEHE